MKKYGIMLLAAMLSMSCNSQENRNSETPKHDDQASVETPKGNWKVHKEFDDDGNLISYDSTYTWSSNRGLEQMTDKDRDSVLQAMQSRFYQHFSGFDLNDGDQMDLFSEDSLFAKKFFDDSFFDSEFGEEFMDIDRIQQHMHDMQQKFLDKYRSEFRKSETDTIGGDI
jgi:hypothetical protein